MLRHACMLARIKQVHALPVPVLTTHTLADSHVVGCLANIQAPSPSSLVGVSHWPLTPRRPAPGMWS